MGAAKGVVVWAWLRGGAISVKWSVCQGVSLL